MTGATGHCDVAVGQLCAFVGQAHLEVRLEVREPAVCQVDERPRIHRRLEFRRYYLRIAARTGYIPCGSIAAKMVPPLNLSFRPDPRLCLWLLEIYSALWLLEIYSAAAARNLQRRRASSRASA